MNIMRHHSVVVIACTILLAGNPVHAEDAVAAPAPDAAAEAPAADAAAEAPAADAAAEAPAADAAAEAPAADAAAEAPAPEPLVLDTVEVAPGVDTLDLSPHLNYFEDIEGKLTIDDIGAEGFQAKFNKLDEGVQVPAFGMGQPSAYWFRVVIDNKTETIQWVIEASYAALDSIHFYQKDADGNWKGQISGDSEPFKGRYWDHPNPNFMFERWEGDTTPVFLRVTTKGSMKLPLKLYSERAFGLKSMDELFGSGIFYGIFLVMIIFNGLMFIPLRDVNYLLYVGFLSLFLLFQMNLLGHGFEYLWPNSPHLNNLTLLFFIFSAFYCALEFTRRFNQAEQYAPRFNKVLKVAALIMLTLSLVQFAAPYKIMIGVVILSVLVGCGIIVSAGVSCMKAGFRPARFFVGAWGIFLVGVVLFALVTAGRIPSNPITEGSYRIGSTILVTFLALALVDRFRFLQEKGES